jgi:hypothetical protein
VVSLVASSPRKSVMGSRSGSCFTAASDLDIPPASSLMSVLLLRGGQVCVCTSVEAPLWCSRRCYGEVILGSHPADRAGTAPPCHLDKRLGER